MPMLRITTFNLTMHMLDWAKNPASVVNMEQLPNLLQQYAPLAALTTEELNLFRASVDTIPLALRPLAFAMPTEAGTYQKDIANALLHLGEDYSLKVWMLPHHAVYVRGIKIEGGCRINAGERIQVFSSPDLSSWEVLLDKGRVASSTIRGYVPCRCRGPAKYFKVVRNQPTPTDWFSMTGSNIHHRIVVEGVLYAM